MLLNLSALIPSTVMSEQVLVRLTKQNSSREMYSPIRRHIKEQLKTQALSTHGLCLELKRDFYLSSTPDEDRGSKALVFLTVLYHLSSTPDEDHGSKGLVFLIVLYVSSIFLLHLTKTMG